MTNQRVAPMPAIGAFQPHPPSRRNSYRFFTLAVFLLMGTGLYASCRGNIERAFLTGGLLAGSAASYHKLSIILSYVLKLDLTQEET